MYETEREREKERERKCVSVSVVCAVCVWAIFLDQDSVYVFACGFVDVFVYFRDRE